jgi:hypothetical protein
MDMCDLVPLSVLALDFGGVPPEGWPDFLGRKGIAFVGDDIGRDCVSRRDAQILLAEKRQNELRAVKHRQMQEQQAVQDDERRRALIWKGLPADRLPVGASAGEVMAAAARDGARPRRTTVLEDALSGAGTTFHPLPGGDE